MSNGNIEYDDVLYLDINKEYNITFNTNGGNELKGIEVNESSFKSMVLPVPVREGYDFTGWYLDEKLPPNVR
jgi:hypothetical protein